MYVSRILEHQMVKDDVRLNRKIIKKSEYLPLTRREKRKFSSRRLINILYETNIHVVPIKETETQHVHVPDRKLLLIPYHIKHQL